MALLQVEDAVQRIDRADGGGAERHDDRADVLGAQRVFQRVEVHAAGSRPELDGDELEAQYAGDALMGVVGLVGCGDGAKAWMKAAGDPQSFQIGEWYRC